MNWVLTRELSPRPARLLTPRKEEVLRDRVAQARFRRRVLKRDGYRCTSCNKSEDEIKRYEQPGWNVLEAAHKRSRKHFKGNEEAFYDAANGIAVCRRCHQMLPKEE